MNNLQISVSIGNVNKALADLKLRGISQQSAEKILAYESYVAIEQYRIIPTIAASPYLIDYFDEQHMDEILMYAYACMEEFSYDILDFKRILDEMMLCHSAEDLIRDPSQIRRFIKEMEEAKSTCPDDTIVSGDISLETLVEDEDKDNEDDYDEV